MVAIAYQEPIESLQHVLVYPMEPGVVRLRFNKNSHGINNWTKCKTIVIGHIKCEKQIKLLKY